MKLEDQVCTLGQSRELDELGVTADSYFVWLHPHDEKISSTLYRRDRFIKGIEYIFVPAYSCAELGVMLSDDLPILRMSKDACEAHARGDWLIHLIKAEIIKPEDLKL